MSRCLVLLLVLNVAIATSLRARKLPRDDSLNGLQYGLDDPSDPLTLRSAVLQRTRLGDEDEQIGWIKRDDPTPTEDQYDLGVLATVLRPRSARGYVRVAKTKQKPCYWSLVACF